MGLSIGLWIFIGLILMLIAEFAPPPPRRSQNTKIRKPKRSYKSSDYTIDSTSFHVVYSGDCEPVGIGDCGDDDDGDD